MAMTRVEVWRDGLGQVIPDLAYSTGEVALDGTNNGVRGTLQLTAARDMSDVLWDMLAPTGTEVVPYRGVKYIDGLIEWVPLGVFGIDSQSQSYDVDGTISLTCPDRWVRVQRSRFLRPTTTNGGAVTEAIRLIRAAISVAYTNTATSTATTRPQVWTDDRAAATGELLKSAAAEAFFDRAGSLLARDLPRLTDAPVWTVDAGASGVLVGATRSRDRARTFNIVIAIPESLDGAAPWPPQIAYDTDPASDTYVGGPFGQSPMPPYSSPLLTTAAQGLAAARAILSRVTGLASQVSIESSVNPALDPGDVISVVFPGGRTETHLIDTVTIPLDTDTPQKITTRSTRPEGDVPA
jgi:Domain of unknown function (DUF5047)